MKQATTVGEIVDRDKQFRIMYLPEIDAYIMAVVEWWVAVYDRYYIIEKDDYELYLSCREKFYEKFSSELRQDSTSCFTKNFAGSGALRDYDGQSEFQNSYAKPDGIINAFQNHGYENGILYARIVWENTEIYVPPVQAIKKGETYEFPLRKKCKLQRDKEGHPICYKLEM